MGWSSGVTVFDKVTKVLLRSITPFNEKLVKSILKTLITSLEDQDCDTLDSSDYYNYPVVQEVMKELHPDWDCWI